MIVVLLILLVVFMITTSFFAFKAYNFAKIILNIQDAVEESLDVLDDRYKNIAEILQKPVFFDSLEVRQVIEEISITRDAVLYVASKLENSQKVNLNDKNDNEEEKDNKKE